MAFLRPVLPEAMKSAYVASTSDIARASSTQQYLQEESRDVISTPEHTHLVIQIYLVTFLIINYSFLEHLLVPKRIFYFSLSLVTINETYLDFLIVGCTNETILSFDEHFSHSLFFFFFFLPFKLNDSSLKHLAD